MNTSIIVVDIGNTNTSFALARFGRLSRIANMATKGQCRENISRALARLVRGRNVTGSALCSVVPAVNCLWLQELTDVAEQKPLKVNHRLDLGIDIEYPNPARIGADRLANACAAVERYGAPVIVVDFGTALTFDIISSGKAYIGGVIAPGLPLMTDYLFERTALLPKLTLKSRQLSRGVKRMRAVGKSTKEAMLIGARFGYLGMVKEILACLRKDMQPHKVRLCATGGYAKMVLAGSNLHIHIDPDLTLYGTSRIYELNRL